ncbi:2-oxoacid:acceptor oxidoreductase subunit alpha [Chloroflexus sp. Y-396-1]|uniref:2-oxoacid:acceptor oxidoreductase subunit alpha n=1 Tax=Chloroflexus sp. Y-396-1 TaxID=867845 RepID=UPI00048D8EA6|nr:2-oxoacid:acceptor oxidoreductase subunit alpha [Chloroflexus sp. Y-396-1]
MQSPQPVVNEFAITAATVNGSGSQTANMVLMRAIFQMGVPVSGKNLFPSNIQGEPTWYTLRVSQAGYIARPAVTPILVAFNPRTANEDLAQLPTDGICLYPADGPWQPQRSDIIPLAIPVRHILDQVGVNQRLRPYATNMVYVGVLAALLGIEETALLTALRQQFRGRPSAVELNLAVIRAAQSWAAAEPSPAHGRYRVHRMQATRGMMLIDGNTAAAIGALTGGVGVVAWYPITPSSSLIEALESYLPRLRPASDGATCAIVQAEDEIAALGIVIGAGWAGARAMTATSGPGISLMTEFAGLGFFAEIPAVIWDVQRVGPSTGLPTRTAQSDLLSVYYLGHGDTRHVILLPGTMEECFSDAQMAFDLAEQLQTPVFVLSDLDLGMNIWMSHPFPYPEQSLQRGKVLSAEDLARLKTYARFADIDGDGIGYRTLPGNPHPLAATLSRGTGHNERNVYSERPDDWQRNMARLWRKHETARRLVPRPVIEINPQATIGLIGFGSTAPAISEARDLLAAAGIQTSSMRIRALPFGAEVTEFIAHHQHCVVVEQNHDGQLRQLLQLHCPAYATRLGSVAWCDGLPLTAPFVRDQVLNCLEQMRESSLLVGTGM